MPFIKKFVKEKKGQRDILDFVVMAIAKLYEKGEEIRRDVLEDALKKYDTYIVEEIGNRLKRKGYKVI